MLQLVSSLVDAQCVHAPQSVSQIIAVVTLAYVFLIAQPKWSIKTANDPIKCLLNKMHSNGHTSAVCWDRRINITRNCANDKQRLIRQIPLTYTRLHARKHESQLVLSAYKYIMLTEHQIHV